MAGEWALAQDAVYAERAVGHLVWWNGCGPVAHSSAHGNDEGDIHAGPSHHFTVASIYPHDDAERSGPQRIAENYDRMGRLSESERLRVLRVLDDLATHIPTRSDAEWTGNYGRFVGPAGRADTAPVCEPRLQRQPLILMVAR